MKLDYPKHVIERHLPLVMAKLDIDLTGKYYTIIEHKTIKERGKDQYGRYNITESVIRFSQYDTEEELKDHMIGMAESRDDITDYNIIKKGEIPEQLQNTEKAVAKAL